MVVIHLSTVNVKAAAARNSQHPHHQGYAIVARHSVMVVSPGIVSWRVFCSAFTHGLLLLFRSLWKGENMNIYNDEVAFVRASLKLDI